YVSPSHDLLLQRPPPPLHPPSFPTRRSSDLLTGRLTPPPGASFECVLLPDDEALYVMASDAGYGFVAKGDDLQAKNKAGKALLTDRKSTRLNSSHVSISYAVFCLKKKTIDKN